jgi:hypothetical protein
MEALRLVLGIGEIEVSAWNDMINLPFTIVRSRHASFELLG